MDFNQNAKRVVDIATGQAERDAPLAPPKATPQSKGGHTRATNLSASRRSEIARKAALTRWNQPAGA